MKNSTDNYGQKKTGKGMNSTDNMNDGPIDRIVKKVKAGVSKVKSNMSKRSKENYKKFEKVMNRKKYH